MALPVPIVNTALDVSAWEFPAGKGISAAITGYNSANIRYSEKIPDNQ